MTSIDVTNSCIYTTEMVPPKNIALFDIDNTLSKKFLITPIIRSEQAHGLLPSGTYEQSIELLAAVKTGEIEYESAAHSLLVLHAGALKGQSIMDLAAHAYDYLQTNIKLFRQSSSRLIQLLRPTHELIAVTAEPEYMARATVEILGMHKALTSIYGVESGTFTGKIENSLAHRAQKHRLTKSLHPDFAFGDSSGDIEMLRHARYAYCISPDDALIQEAKEDGWDVYEGDTDVNQLVASINTRPHTRSRE